MKIKVIAKPGSRKEAVKKIEENTFVISIKEPPIHGLANLGIINSLSKYFGIPKKQIRIVTGFKSKNKIFEIIQQGK